MFARNLTATKAFNCNSLTNIFKKTNQEYAKQNFNFISITFLGACKKNSDFQYENSNLNANEIENQLGKELVIAVNEVPEFKRVIEEECLKQVRGDYNVGIDRILEIGIQKQLVPQNHAKKIDELSKQMVRLKPGRLPIIFVPVVEIFDPNANIYKGRSLLSRYENASIEHSSIRVVSRDAQVTKEDLYPGYYFNAFDKWDTCGLISEDFAWKNDVWVIGYEENISSEKQVTTIKPSSIKDSSGRLQLRPNGRAEYGGRLQVLDLGEIESWVSGKPEFKYFINNAFGTLIKELRFFSIERSNFSDRKWVDYNDFIGYWNTSNWGNITYERWIEEDGGSPITISSTIPNPSGGPTLTISQTLKDDDDNLGLANVQFTDSYYKDPSVAPAYWTVYNLSYMNFQRK